MVYAIDSKPIPERVVGSSPTSGTKDDPAICRVIALVLMSWKQELEVTDSLTLINGTVHGILPPFPSSEMLSWPMRAVPMPERSQRAAPRVAFPSHERKTCI